MISSVRNLVIASLASTTLAMATAGQETAPARGADDAVTAYRVGKVVTMDAKDTVINGAVVLVQGKKILSISRADEAEIPDGAEVIEMPECWLVPGMIDGHNHIGADSPDLHDYVYLTNPGLRTLDAVKTRGEDIDRARAGGMASALLIPGSGTNMSGFGTMIKFSGGSTEDAVLKYPGSIKIAQAGNPERYWYGVNRAMMNYNTRQTLEAAKRYHEGWEAYEKGETTEAPAFDPTFHDFRGLFRHEFVASMHTQQYQVVLSSIDMLGNKLGVKTVLDHSTFDGFRTAPYLLENPTVSTIVGPRAYYYDRTERKLHGVIARWWQGGVEHVGVNTDSPVIPQEELFYQAAMGCWYGWVPYEALRGVTRTNAENLMVIERVGSIEPGKDADFCIYSGDPIDPRSICWINVINGKIVHDNREGIRRV